MAFTLFSDRAHAKTGDSRPTVWEKHFENRLSWRFLHKKAVFTPKPATFDPRLGKNHWETAYHGGRQEKGNRISEIFPIGEPIRIGEIVRDGPCRRSDRRQEAHLPVSLFQGVKESCGTTKARHSRPRAIAQRGLLQTADRWTPFRISSRGDNCKGAREFSRFTRMDVAKLESSASPDRPYARSPTSTAALTSAVICSISAACSSINS